MARVYRSNSLSISEQEQLFSVVTNLEDMVLFKLELSTGIRREDISNIKIDDIDLPQKKLKFWEGKKKRMWEVPLTNEVANLIEMYVKTMRKDGRNRQLMLFEFTGRTAYNRLQNYLKKAGINKVISFHDLRRSFMKTAKRRGILPKALSQITGDTLATIERYYENLTMDELREEVEKLNGDKLA